MARNKRSSMREGPLAALFKRTDHGDDEIADQQEQADQESREADKQQQGQSKGAVTESPSPTKRLKEAFSSAIPHNIMDRSDSPAGRPDPTIVTQESVSNPTIRVVGVGGAGVNAVNRMIEAGVEGVEFIAINTDLQSLQESAADVTIHIGELITKGLGAGSNPDVGREAVEEDRDKIKSLLKGSDMVFVAAGAGGGTGTGAAPVVAQIARSIGALSVGIVSKPFTFEGSKRKDQGEFGVTELRKQVDTLIVVPNNRLLSVLERGTSMVQAFGVADDVLRQGVQGISDLVTLPGLINLDFADVRTVMSDAGDALLGIGMGEGEQRAMEAASQAVSSPLLETSIDGAHSILLSITGGSDLSLWEVNDAAKAVAEAAHPDANIIFGAMVDEKVGEQVWVTVVATGYGEKPVKRQKLRESSADQPRFGRHDPIDKTEKKRDTGRPTGRALGEIDVPEFMPRG